jgi:L-threonylcarbamoyladenylate synthase
MLTTLRLDADRLAEAAQLLRQGQLVAFPTETVYGLGADALNAEAVAGIYEAKGRPAHNPLIVHVCEVAEAQAIAHWNPQAALLAARYWPGPLTLVLPAREMVPALVRAGGPTVAVRMPAHPLALALLRLTGRPLAAPSANRSGRLSPTMPEHVLADLDGRIAAVVLGGPTTAGIESTVVDVSGAVARLLRPGPIAPDELTQLLGVLDREPPRPGGLLASPGLLEKHYAPRTPLHLALDSGVDVCIQWRGEGQRIGWLGPALPTLLLPPAPVEILPPDAPGFAAELYAALHRLDQLGLDRIVVAALPNTDDWLAVRDRLRRAAF